MQKIWEKDLPLDKAIEQFTIGRDAILDLELAPFDVLGSLAHVKMLAKSGLITAAEAQQLTAGLRTIYEEIREGRFVIEEGIEDVHSEVEKLLTERLGDAGKKVHTARSRNDQVILDIRLFTRDRLAFLRQEIVALGEVLLTLAARYREVLMPGYTHFQVAMPSSFGLWFGSFAESLADDLLLLGAAWHMVNQNPLGSAAGYGSSFPIDREETTRLLGFEALTVNAVYAQAGRGKTEKTAAMALASVASTLARLAMDAVLFMNQNFGFMELPDAYTTGSSIMPHKKNPDAFELVRGHCNKLQALPNGIQLIITNLPTGYHRDFQLLKEEYLPAFDTLGNCLRITRLLLENLKIREDILEDEKYRYLFSVEEVNRLVSEGLPFREAYKRVAQEIADGTYSRPEKVSYTHTGSIGNPGNDLIREKLHRAAAATDNTTAEQALQALLKETEK
jgi:argininosuccinate lyase